MKELPENFCIAPFTQLTTHPAGSFGPCPYLGGTQWKLNEKTSLQDRWNSKDYTILRNQFINNEKPTICERCWHEEDNNKQSRRLMMWNKHTQKSDFGFNINKKLIDDIINDINTNSTPKLKFLTIKNGNVCDAKCRSCHPGDSSRFLPDAKKLQVITNKEYYNLSPYTSEEKNWNSDNIDQIVSLSDDLLRIECYGGESLYNKKVHTILNKIVESGNSEHITLYINTNGNHLPNKLFPIISKFKSVEIFVSIDGVNDMFTYIRHPIEWNSVVRNVEGWHKFFKEYKINGSIDAITTVSIMNIFYLPEIKQQVQKMFKLAPYWNLLVDPNYYFIKNMPDYIKEKIITKLSTDIDEFSDLISVINEPSDLNEWFKYLEVSTAMDNIRKENFSAVFPEFAKIQRDWMIKEYIPNVPFKWNNPLGS